MSACDEIRPLVSALQDGELSPGEAAPVRAHLAGCASCREVLDSHAALAELVSQHARTPRIEPGEWASFEERLELELSRARKTYPRKPFARLLALGPVLSAAAAALLALGLGRALLSEDRSVALAYTPLHLPDVPLREPSLEDASPRAPSGEGQVAPRDLRGVEGAGAAKALTDAQRKALEKNGIVQVPGNASLDAFYGDRAPPGVRPLVTADAALLLFQGAARRAALEVEREHIAPGLERTLEILSRELSRFEESARTDEVRRSARLARRIVAVALALEGKSQAGLSGETAVVDDARLVREGKGRGLSRVLGRELDLDAIAPRGDLALLPDHARAVGWLAQASLRLDSEHEDEARAASLVVLALANARALALWNDVDDAVTFLHGPQDDLGAFDLLRATRRALGDRVDPDSLGTGEALARVERAALDESRAGGAGRIAQVSSATPTFRLVGGARSLEAIVLSALADKVPGRAHPTSLDLLGALGSREARTIASSEGLPGYNRALEGVSGVVADVTELPRATSRSGSGIERSKLFAIARLLEQPPASAPPAMRTREYEDRLVLAALAGLSAAPAGSLETRPGAEARSTLPQVEPLPGCYARLAYAARRLALGLEGSAATRSSAVEQAVKRLERAGEILSGLARASAEVLEGKTLSQESREALAAFEPAVLALAPHAAFSVEDVHVRVQNDGSREILERTVGPIDALYLVLPVPGEGKLELAVGPALSAREIVVKDVRTTEDDVRRGPRAPDPEWATHIMAR